MSRTDRVSAALGPALMRGDTMLAESCFDCGTVLMRTRGTNEEYCVLCRLDAAENNESDIPKEVSISSDAKEGGIPEETQPSFTLSEHKTITSETTQDDHVSSSEKRDDPAEILRQRRIKRDGIADLIGEKMLQGYAMSGSYCDKCTTVLLCDKSKNLCCFGCVYDMAKKPPGHNKLAELSTQVIDTKDKKSITSVPITSSDQDPGITTEEQVALKTHTRTSVIDKHPSISYAIEAPGDTQADDNSEHAAQLIGEALLAGNVMLNKVCDLCGTVLLRDTFRNEFCVLCRAESDRECKKEDKLGDVEYRIKENSLEEKATPPSATPDRTHTSAGKAETALDGLTTTLLSKIEEYTRSLSSPNLSLEDAREISETIRCMLETLEKTYCAQTSATKYARLQ